MEPWSSTPPAKCDLAVVGGGILGLAVAREMITRHPRASVWVLEREPELAAHQSGQNSGVIHAGIYYAPGSLKARLCIEGARELYAYCERRAIAVERCGKLIIATDTSELARLEELERRGRANRVPGLRRLEATAIADIEPHARGIAALHSPASGLVDFSLVARAYAEDVLETGGSIACGCDVAGVQPASGALRLEHSLGVTEARSVLFCAGGWADRLAVSAGAGPDPRIVPFRGAYLRLLGDARRLVRALIYPVPDPSLPFLGVHLSRRIDGEVLIGPTASIAGTRDGRGRGAVRGGDLIETLRWPGTWRMLASWWRTGVAEARHAALPSTLVTAASRYVPELRGSDVEAAFAGVRAQALGRDGRLIDDFVFSHTERALHVRNAPSPGATASLAIARHIAEQAERTLTLS